MEKKHTSIICSTVLYSAVLYCGQGRRAGVGIGLRFHACTNVICSVLKSLFQELVSVLACV